MIKYCGNCGYLRRACPINPDICVSNYYSRWKPESEVQLEFKRGHDKYKRSLLNFQAPPIVRKIRSKDIDDS